jgi:hypothetical protein
LNLTRFIPATIIWDLISQTVSKKSCAADIREDPRTIVHAGARKAEIQQKHQEHKAFAVQNKSGPILRTGPDEIFWSSYSKNVFTFRSALAFCSSEFLSEKSATFRERALTGD